MDEMPLITNIMPTELNPGEPCRVIVDTDDGLRVLVISEEAAKDLTAHLQRYFPQDAPE